MNYDWVKCPKEQKGVSPSGAACGLICARKWMFKYRWGLFPKMKPYSSAASLGKLVHRLAEVGEENVLQVREEVVEMQKNLMVQVENGDDLDGSLVRKANQLTELYSKALCVMKLFWEAHPPTEKLVDIGRELWVESIIRVSGTELPIRGRMDRLHLNEAGDVFVRDIKTTGQAPLSMLLTGYQFSLQCRFYRLLAQAYVKQQGIKNSRKIGFIIDAMLMPTIKFCKKDTDFNAYLSRVKEWYKEKQEEASLSWLIRYGEEGIPSELREALQRILLLREMDPVPDNYPRNVTQSGCTAYRKVCPYYTLCEMDPLQWEAIIAQQYEWSTTEEEEPSEEEGTGD